MENITKIEAVTERDIDLLLLEELSVSDEFPLWLYSIVAGANDAPSCEGAWHSISDPSLGESDLIVIYENGVAVLLENKIDAPAQPEQGQRYRARGEIERKMAYGIATLPAWLHQIYTSKKREMLKSMTTF
jgi:hypothetical protein